MLCGGYLGQRRLFERSCKQLEDKDVYEEAQNDPSTLSAPLCVP